MPKGYRAVSPFCTVEGCDRKHEARGYCDRHYYHFRVSGDPLKETAPALTWLKNAVANRDRSDCWDWPFYRCSTGYGRIYFQGAVWGVPAVALVLDGIPKPKPPNHHSLHSCDNRSCCNPAHLRWGSNAENVEDMVARRRQRGAAGERNTKAKLTPTQVLAIRADTRRQIDIAAEYGLSQTSVSAIKRLKNWSHL